MNMLSKYYRVLNEIEELGDNCNSVDEPTPRQQAVQEFYPQIQAICILSLQCSIKLSSALRIASQYGQVLGDVQNAIRNGDISISLDLFLVFDEDKTMIPLQPVVDFIVNYNQIYENTGLFIDEDRGDGQYIWEGVWEFVRRKLYPSKNSRLESIFAFENAADAHRFVKEYRGLGNVAQVEIESANIERYDMQWMTDVPETATMEVASQYAINYWEGKATNSPIYEVLIKGQYKLVETND